MKASRWIKMFEDLDQDVDVTVCVLANVRNLKRTIIGEAEDETVTVWADAEYMCDWFGDGKVRVVCCGE